ncbi:MAG TPA: hypothetical protein VKX41_03295, partial [Alloacidobacterium sp.]|nr:hypothetical protein [Alloacidobacterium sp.]
AVPFPVPTPASSVGSIVLVPEVSLPLFVPTFQAYKPNQLCERNPTLSPRNADLRGERMEMAPQ